MRTTARIFGFAPAGTSRRIALALLGVAALSVASSGCGAGSEALPSDLPPPASGGSLIITTSTMEDGVFMRSYSKTLDTIGGTPPLVGCLLVAGALPPGLGTIPSGSTCVISGTPTAAGSFTFTVRAEDTNNIADTQDYTVVIRDEFTLTGPAPDPLPDGVEDVAYNFVFTVTTDTVIGPDDFGQAAENGNGPLTMCTLGGLPAGMMAVGGTFTANSCQITISGTPNIGLAPMDAPVTFQLTLTVTDSGIGGSSTPPGTVTQTAIDLTINPPIAIALITTDAADTNGCTGGTFDDSTGGGAAPDAVTLRTYGDPQCDLLFSVTGGLAPYTWTDNSVSPLTPFVCAQEGANNEFFRCNSAAVINAGGTTADVTVQVMDSAGTTQGTDIFGHASHSIFVNNAVAVVSDLGPVLPDAVRLQPYGEAPATPPTFTASDGLGGYVFSTATGGMNNGDLAFPATIGCTTAGNVFTCATNASTITAGVGTYTPTVDVDDSANDTTPSGTGMVTVNIDVVAAMMFTLITSDPVGTIGCTGGTFTDTTGDAPDAGFGIQYGDNGGAVGPPDCTLLFGVTGGRPPYTWVNTIPGPTPVGCAQEGANNEFFRCDSGGAAILDGPGPFTIGVEVSDSGNTTLGPIMLDTDAQGHMVHNIEVTDFLFVLSNPNSGLNDVLLDGVTLRAYGTPTLLTFTVAGNRGVGLVSITPDGAGFAGGPATLECNQMMDRQLECATTTVITDAAGAYTLAVGAMDTGNDMVPQRNISQDFFLTINNEIVIDNLFLTNGVVNQFYTQTLACDGGTGFCGGTGTPDNAAALFTWSETGGPAHADILVTGTNVAQPGDGLYSGTPTTDATGLMPTITVTDDGNATTPDCNTAGTCPLFTPTYNIFLPTAIVDAAEARVQRYTTDTGAPVFVSPAIDLDATSTPFRAAFSPNGTIIVVGDDGEGEVSLINFVTSAVTQVDTSGGAGNATGVTIGPKTSPLASPDSWVAYIANPTGGVTGNMDIVDIEPGGTFGTFSSTAILGAKDVAITPTFAGPETRVYVLSGLDDVCAIDADPGSIGTVLDIDPGAGTCIDTSGVAGDTRFIEIASSRAFVTKSTGILVAIDITPGSLTRDQVVDTEDLSAAGCTAPGDLRANPAGTEIWVACGADDQVTIANSSTLGVITSFSTGAATSPQDIAFNIDGSLALVTLAGSDEVLPVDTSGPTPGTAVSTTAPSGMANDITVPEGIDHIRDPQLNALIDAVFTITLGQQAERMLTARGGVQPYAWKETSETLGVPGTACQGLSLDSRTGRISGVPMQPGTCTFTVTVSDSNGQSRTVEGRIEVKP